MRIAIIILLAGYALAKQAHTEHATVRSPQEELSEEDPDISKDLSVDDGSAPMAPTEDTLDSAEVEAGNAQARAEGTNGGDPGADEEMMADEDESAEEDSGEEAKEETASGACAYKGWWSSFDRAGWSKCQSDKYYVNGLWRNDNKGNNDGLFLVEKGYCCQRSGVFGNAGVKVKGGNWAVTLDRKNTWAGCPNGYFLNGFYRSNSDNIKGGTKGGLHNLEKARCTRPSTAPATYGNCYDENVGLSFDKKGLSKCRPGYFLSAIWKGGCDKLYCLEKFKCCRMRSPKAALPKVSNCGPTLKPATGAKGVPAGWTLCYLDKSQAKLADAPCKTLLKGSAYKGKGFGCWHGRNVNDNDMAASACKPNVQNDLTINDWPQYPTIFGVCFKN